MSRNGSKGLAGRLMEGTSPAVAHHPVEFMTANGQGAFIRVPVQAIDTNPDQPRKFFDHGALEELAESIRQNGILQPIIVKPGGPDRYLLVAGERRYRAACLAGLSEVPSVVTTGDEQEIALIENVQRQDLSPLEEAEALHALKVNKGYSQAQLAAVVGKSRVAVTELLSLNKLPPEVKHECRAPDIATKTHLLQVVREPTREKQLSLWEAIRNGQMTTKDLRRARPAAKKAGRPKGAVRRFKDDTLGSLVTVRISRRRVAPADYVAALQAAIREIRQEPKE